MESDELVEGAGGLLGVVPELRVDELLPCVADGITGVGHRRLPDRPVGVCDTSLCSAERAVESLLRYTTPDNSRRLAGVVSMANTGWPPEQLPVWPEGRRSALAATAILLLVLVGGLTLLRIAAGWPDARWEASLCSRPCC